MQVHFPQPQFSAEEAVKIAKAWYALEASAKPLPSERDQNFYLKTSSGDERVLKISSEFEQRSVLELQNHAMKHLASHDQQLRVPYVQSATNGQDLVVIQDTNGKSHFLRLLTYVPGIPLAHVKPHSAELLMLIGNFLGIMDRCLQDFSDPALFRELKWDLAHAEWVLDYQNYVVDSKRAIIEKFYAEYERILPLLMTLRSGAVYNDANDYNILVQPASERNAPKIGAIDFGDMLHTQQVCEVAVAAAYCMLGKPDPVTAATHVVRGYHDQFALSEPELEILFPLICMRLCTTVVNAAYQRHVEPDNPYLTISEAPAWQLIEKLAQVNSDYAHFRFRHACDFSVTPHAYEIVSWLSENGQTFGPVLKPMKKYEPLDLGVGSVLVGNLSEPDNMKDLSHRIVECIRSADADAGIGRYNEARLLSNSPVFQAPGNERSEARTIHLGVDIFTETGNLVFAPLDGIVHSLQNNSAAFDYGPTIILQHETDENRIRFFTLYGHLSTEVLDGFSVGQPVKKGAVLGRVGPSSINGGWPPHVHFQIILHMLGRQGDFPGNAIPSQREFWLALCPDPNLILGLQHPALTPQEAPIEKLLTSRQTYLSDSLSISYSKPLHIVRGSMQYLFDNEGQRYLDCVNNVAHVGHCHPKVVKAACDQSAVLNTNTRYLHSNIVTYAERLIATLPDPLRICFFVNSGSEANELALRLARTFTKAKDTIVMESGYHGNTGGTIEISPYKFNGPGGSGPAPHVHTVSMPDLFRGRFRAGEPEAGRKYADLVRQKLTEIRNQGKRCAAFICESMPGCGGQIIFPPGYLREAYQAVREGGGVCIADEVQTGFGRCGTHFWAFETQGVVPDIITAGKPIGNGHPLGLVVTTREIADAFCNGMEYFNTFGGNPVSCAIGIAVLDVISEERLQQNALCSGSYLLDGLRNVSEKQPLIGDVRGIGLFLGIELVTNRETKEPAAKEATKIINRMKDRGILLSTDGPLHNVIKIKPPMVFSREDADFLISNLNEVLEENC